MLDTSYLVKFDKYELLILLLHTIHLKIISILKNILVICLAIKMFKLFYILIKLFSILRETTILKIWVRYKYLVFYCDKIHNKYTQ